MTDISSSHRTRWAHAIAWATGFFLFVETALCQTAGEASPQNETTDSSPAALQIREVGGEVIAEPVSVVPAVPENVAPAFISLLRFDGEVIDRSAKILAEIHVSLTRDGVWEEVFLRLPEAQILGVDYVGNGQHAPVVVSDRSDGLSWKFRGLGTHRLLLNLEVPITRAADGKSLSLTLPKLHRLFASELNLRVPETPLELRVEGGDITESFRSDRGTDIKVRMPGLDDESGRSKIRLAWSKPVDVTPGTVASSTTRMTLQAIPDRDRLRLVAEQTIVALDQNLQSLRVSVPTGFDAETDLIQIEGPRFDRHLPGTDADGRQFVNVTLVEQATPATEIKLTWIFERALDDTESKLILDGFSVANAKRQIGSITILPTERYRLSVDWPELKGARRSIAAVDNATAIVSINEHPYAVPVRARKERPFVTVAPVTEIELSSLEASLRTDFSIGVDRSEVDELTIDWTVDAARNWQNLRVLTPDDATLAVDGNKSVISLKRPRNGPFSVVIAGEQPLAGVATSQFALPRMLAETEKATELRLYTTDAVEAQIQAIGESHLLNIATSTAELESRDSEGLRLITHAHVAGEPAAIDVEWTIRESVLKAATTVTVEPQTQRTGAPIVLNYSQQIDVGVNFGRRDELRLVLPETLRAGISTAVLAADLRLKVDGQPVPSGSITDAGAGAIRLGLDRPVSECRIDIEAIPILIASDRTTARIPLIRVVDTTFDSLRCLLPRNDVITITPFGGRQDGQKTSDSAGTSNWVESPVSSPAWSTWVMPEIAPSIDGFELEVSSSIDDTQAVYGVKQADVEVRRSTNSVTVRADFDIYEVVDSIVLGLPESADAVRFTWNGSVVREYQTVSDGSLSDLPQSQDAGRIFSEGTRIVGIATGDGSRAGLLSVSYRLPPEEQSAFKSDEIALPVLPANGVWLDTPARIELVINPDRHLLFAPARLAKSYQWTRTGFIWSRVSNGRSLFPQDSTDIPDRGYLFTAQSIPASIRVTTAQGSLLVLLGSATTFAIAFLVYQFPPLRRLPMLLGFGIVLAFVGALNTEFLQVLLQPAALGVALAIIAVAIDRIRSTPSVSTPVVTVVADSQLSQLSGEVVQEGSPSNGSVPSETVLGSVSHSATSM